MCRCDIHEAWVAVRNTRTYIGVVNKAEVWIELFWPEARSLGFAPRSLRSLPVPPIRIGTVREDTAGKYTVDGRIILADEVQFSALRDYIEKVYRRKEPPLRDELREVILHEVQHAIDDAMGYPDTGGDEVADHDVHFHRRLGKLRRMFPVEGA